MKVYVVESVTAEPYESYSGVHSVFSTREKAEAFVKGKGPKVQEQDLSSGEYGFYFRGEVYEMEVL